MVHNGGVSDHSYVADDPSGTMEYLDTGAPVPDRAPRRKARPWAPIVAGVVVFLLALVAIGIVGGDWAARTVEARALLTQIDKSEAAMQATQEAVQAAFDTYTSLESPTAEDQATLDAALKAAAAKGHDAVAAAATQVAGVKILRWHPNLAEAQKAYLAHNLAWQDYLSQASADAAVFAQPAENVNATFDAAEEPLRAAVPRPDVLDLQDRIDVIYAPAPSSGGGQQA